MTHRSTFSLDESTTQRIRLLAHTWKVSQAEVIRRAIASAQTAASEPDPVALLQALHTQGAGLSPAAAKAYLTEVRQDRKQWRGR